MTPLYGRVEGNEVVYGSQQPAITAKELLGANKTFTRSDVYQTFKNIGVPNGFYGREVRAMEMKKKWASAAAIILSAVALGVGIGITAYSVSGTVDRCNLVVLGAILVGGGIGIMLFFPPMMMGETQIEREKYLDEQLNSNQLQSLLDEVKANLAAEARRLEANREQVVIEAEARVTAAVTAESEISAQLAQF